MIKLIKAEFKKIFKKKSFLVVTIIFILYSVLTNVIYKSLDDYDVYYETVDIAEYMDINNNLDLNREEDRYQYISNLTLIELEELKQKYFSNNQIYLIDEYLYELIEEANETKYVLENEQDYIVLRNKIDEYIVKIKNNDWKFFANIRLKELNDTLLTISDTKTKERYQELIDLVEYRIKNNIPYDYDNYLNNAIEDIEINSFEYHNLLEKDKLTNEEEARLSFLKENYLVNKYILDNKEDINNGESLQAVLANFPAEFGLFILIFVVMVSGSIVSEEINKGTIKYLLTKPFKRSKILTSKLLTVLLFIPLIMFFMIIIEVIIGGIILGIESLSVPILVYDSMNNSLVSYNIFKYLILILISNLSIYLILGILCFMLSTITSSTSAATTITFLFYLISNVISNLALMYGINMFKVFVSLHWDFSYLVNLSNNPYGIDTFLSIIVLCIYIVAMLCLTYVYFNKKDIKNI